MKKRYLLIAPLLFLLVACGVSESSSSKVTTSVGTTQVAPATQTVSKTEDNSTIEISSITETNSTTENNSLTTENDNPIEKGSILIIADTSEDTTQLEAAITSYGYTPSVVAPLNAPTTLSGLAEYKEIILMNVNAFSLPRSLGANLHTYVEKAGGRILTAGGNNTYTNGNMKDTLYEEMLPISITHEVNNPRAIVLCLEYSNSMGMKTFDGNVLFTKDDPNLQMPQSNTRIDIAIKSIVTSIQESLNPCDYLSVITFGPIKPNKGVNETNVVFGLTPATQKKAMIEKVQEIRKPSNEGGTDYDDALEFAEDMLTSFTKKVNKKSVVMINDVSDSNDDATQYMNTIKRMDEKGIDISAITIGTQKSNNVIEMERIIGAGNSYLAQTETQFESIIKELCRSIPMNPIMTLNAAHPFEFEAGTKLATGVNAENLPIINTYNGGLTIKEGATSHIFYHNQEVIQDPNNPNKTGELDNHDPIYATWSYGVGKVGSLMIDLSGKWCPDFYTNVDTQKLLENIIKDLAPKE